MSDTPPPLNPNDPPPTGEVLSYGRASQYDEVAVQPGNPFVTIFTKPGQTMRWILSVDPKMHVMLLVLGAAVLSSLLNALGPFENDGAMGIVLGVPLGILFALIGLYLYGWATAGVGRWFGGTGSREACRCAIAWAQMPRILMVVLALPVVLLIWIAGVNSGAAQLLSLGFGLLGLAAFVYQLVILSFGLGAAHRFSAGIGFATAIVAGILLFLAMLAIIFPIGMVLDLMS